MEEALIQAKIDKQSRKTAPRNVLKMKIEKKGLVLTMILGGGVADNKSTALTEAFDKIIFAMHQLDNVRETMKAKVRRGFLLNYVNNYFQALTLTRTEKGGVFLVVMKTNQ